jgi:hypothetical protein
MYEVFLVMHHFMIPMLQTKHTMLTPQASDFDLEGELTVVGVNRELLLQQQ